MKLKVGDIVEFKNYTDMTNEEHMMIGKDSFPTSGTVRKVFNNFDFFCIEGSLYAFNVKSIARVISDVDNININSLNPGDEVLVKATVKEVFNGFIQVDSSIDKTDVTKIIKRKDPERFVVQEDYYGMYVNGSEVLVVNKDDAKIYNSRNEANEVAAGLHLKDWKVIPYND